MVGAIVGANENSGKKASPGTPPESLMPNLKLFSLPAIAQRSSNSFLSDKVLIPSGQNSASVTGTFVSS